MYGNTKLIKKILCTIMVFILCVGNCFPLMNVYALNVDELGEGDIISIEVNATGEDDTENIQSIIDNEEYKDKFLIVKLKGETYNISNPIVINRGNIKLLGEEGTKIQYSFNYDLVNKDNLPIEAAIYCIATDQTYLTNKNMEGKPTGNIENVCIEKITVDMGCEDPSSNDIFEGRGIAFIRPIKRVSLNNIEVIDCEVKNTYSIGILVKGAKINKKQVPENDELENTNYDERLYYNYYPCENVIISNCKVDNTKIGIRIEDDKNVKILSNNISNSRTENITMQGVNIECNGNFTTGDHVGCGSIALDKCENIKISNNFIYEQNYSRIQYPIYHTGICQNSSAGPTYNCEISNNYIVGAARGIWLKDHRYNSNNPQSGVSSKIGSMPGGGYIIKDNIVKNSEITDIRVDEVILNRIDNEEKLEYSYIINQSHLTLNSEAYNNGEVGRNITLEDNTYLKYYDILNKIEVTTPPSKTTYKEGNNFETYGMVVTATYDNGTTAQITEKTEEDVTGYIITDSDNLAVGKDSVTISYTENGITKETTQAITVHGTNTEQSTENANDSASQKEASKQTDSRSKTEENQTNIRSINENQVKTISASQSEDKVNKNRLPQTGVNYITVGISIFIFSILGILFYRKYNDIKFIK